MSRAMPPKMQVASRTRLEKFYGTDDPLQLTQKQANEVLVSNGRIVMSVDAVKRAITAKLCEQAGRPYGTGKWSHGMEPGTFICRWCGLDPLGSLQAAQDREAEIVEQGRRRSQRAYCGRPAGDVGSRDASRRAPNRRQPR